MREIIHLQELKNKTSFWERCVILRSKFYSKKLKKKKSAFKRMKMQSSEGIRQGRALPLFGSSFLKQAITNFMSVFISGVCVNNADPDINPLCPVPLNVLCIHTHRKAKMSER